MSLKFSRQKDRHFLLSILYKLDKLMPFSKEAKLRLYLDLEWIFDRLAHEQSFRVFRDHPVRLKTFQFLRAHLSHDHRVLDLGCGSGDLSAQMASHVHRVVALDHNPSLIEVAKKNHSQDNLEFQCAEANDYLSSNHDAFDVLVLSHVLEHLDEPEAFLSGYKLFFRYFYLEVPDLERTPLNTYRHQLKVRLQYSDNDHIWEFDRDDMQELIRKCNLKVVASEFRYGVQKYWCEHPSTQQ